jgi:integrase
MLHAGGDDETYQDADPAEYLTPVEREAGRRLHGLTSDTLSDALEQYLRIHPKREDAKFVRYQRLAFDSLLTICGDREVKAFMRADARQYMETALTQVKTTTVRRRIGVFSAVFASYFNENNLQRPNPFAALPIPKEGHDSKHRRPFTATELGLLEARCRGADDSRRWILAMLAGTGARMAEVVGLLLEDIKLDAPVPHVHLQVHPWRDIKGAGGVRGKKNRAVPLAGPALWAASRVVAMAAPGQRFAFPEYTDATECRATSASATLNKWVRGIPLEHTCHDLRHSVKDLLRDVQCPKDINDAITGHGKKDTGDGYGDGYSLTVKAEWLTRALTNAKDRD